MSGLLPGLAVAAFVAVLVLAAAAWMRAQRRRSRKRVPRRPAFGRLRVDPQLVRDRFAQIAAGTPELAREDPRLLALYVIPTDERSGQ